MQLSPRDNAMTTKTAPAKAPSDALLLEIATKHFHSIETLETQNSDWLDFHDVAVWAIRTTSSDVPLLGECGLTCNDFSQ